MSSRSTRKAAATVLDPADEPLDEVTTAAVVPRPLEQTPAAEPQPSAVDEDAVEADAAGDASKTTALVLETSTALANEHSQAETPEDTADMLAQQIEQLVQSVSVVEEISRRARDVATNDLARYDALLSSQQQYASRLEQACAICDQAHDVHQRAFGQAARSAAEPIVADAERVVHAFTQLSHAWQERTSTFLQEHPDIQLLLVERDSQAEQARQVEALAARGRRLRALVAACEEATRSGIHPEGRRVLEVIDREFPDQRATIDQLRLMLEQRERAAKDAAARDALAACAEHQARGDLEGAVNIFEQVDVHGLSVEVSHDVFGRWSDACSRLAQTAAASLLRFAPAQGRGLILYADPAYPNGLIVFSSLGMGPGFPQGKVVTDIAILRRARPFREAAPLPITSWAGLAPSAAGAAVAPVRHWLPLALGGGATSTRGRCVVIGPGFLVRRRGQPHITQTNFPTIA